MSFKKTIDSLEVSLKVYYGHGAEFVERKYNMFINFSIC